MVKLLLFKHNWCVLGGSSLPLTLSLITLFFFSSLLKFLKFGDMLMLIFSCFFLFLILSYWGDNIYFEGLAGYHNFFIMDGFKLGFLFFILSELMFFFSFFWFFFDSVIVNNNILGFDYYLPFGLFLINPFSVPFLNSLILLSSAISLTWCHYGLLSGENNFLSLVFTLLLGFFFLFIQFNEYLECSFSLSDSFFGSIFFLLTGFHGLHVMLGLVLLLLSFFRFKENQFSNLHFLGFEFSIFYWHFVDVVWLFLFVFLYWWVY